MVNFMLACPDNVYSNKETASKSSAMKPSYGGTLSWGIFHKPTIINPILTTQSISMPLLDLIFSRLVRLNGRGQIEADLAKRWEISEDRKVYTFYLRKNVRFSDNVECTAEDVYFTYQTMVDPRSDSPFRFHFSAVSKFEVVDKYIFRIHLKEAVPHFLHKLIREIMPKHLWEGEDIATSELNYRPVGSGPFILNSWNKKTHRMELVANSNYYEGRPYLDRVVIKYYDDNSRLWVALMRHDVDLVQFINPKDYAVIQDDDSFKVYTMDWGMYCAFIYNLNDPILSNNEIRKAIAHSINIPALINAVAEVKGVGSTGPFHPSSIGYNPHVKPLEYNPTKAKMIFMHNGWKDRDGNGILEKDRKDFELKILVDDRSQLFKRIATLIRQQLSEVGIKVVLQLYRAESELTQEYLAQYSPQAWLRFFSGADLGGYQAARDWYSLSSEYGRLWHYKNDKVDKLFESISSLEDEKQQKNVYQNIHRIIYDEQPACFLFYPESLYALRSKFRNADEYFSRFMPTYTMKNWYIFEQ